MVRTASCVSVSQEQAHKRLGPVTKPPQAGDKGTREISEGEGKTMSGLRCMQETQGETSGKQMKTSSEKALAGWTDVTVKVRGQCKPPEETHAGDHGCNHREARAGRAGEEPPANQLRERAAVTPAAVRAGGLSHTGCAGKRRKTPCPHLHSSICNLCRVCAFAKLSH